MPQGATADQWEDVAPAPVIAASAPKQDAEWEDVTPAPTQTMAAGSYQTKPGGPIQNANTPRPVTLGTHVGNAARWMEDQLPGAGMIAGGLLGSAEPVGGNMAGVVLGGAAGESLRRAIQGKPLNAQAAIDIGTAGAQGAASEMGGQILGKGIEAAAPFIKSAVSPASTKAAAQFYERGVAPGGLSAEDQQVMRENFNRAAKYIAPETRGYPVANGEGGAMRTAQIAHRAADNLWQGTVEPVADLFKDVQRPGDEIAGAIRNSFTDLDKQTRGAAVAAGDKLAQFFDGRPVSVGEMKDLITQLNNDRAVSRFYQMSPNEQVAAELGDPSLRGKVAALSKLRESMFDAVGESGGEQLGNQFREARKDWGALRSIEDQIRGTRVPTPQPITTKIANTVRGSLSPKGTDFWLRGSDTLFNLNNPNRLLPKSFNTLGLTDLGPPTMDITPQTRGLLTSGSIITPPPATPSGPVDLRAGGFQPLADNRQLPGAGRASGPQTQSGPSQFGISLPGETPRPLTGPERLIPAQTSPSNTSFPMERGGRGPNQVPPPIELGPSPLEPVPPRMPPKSSSGGNGKLFYHGTGAEAVNSAADLNATQAGEPGFRPQGTFLSSNPEAASGFAEKGGGRVVAGRLAPNAKIFNVEGGITPEREAELASQGYAGIRYKGAGNDEIVKLFPGREKDALIPDVPRKGVEIAGEAKGNGAVKIGGGNGSVVSEPNGSPQSVIESAGGVYWGKDEANGTIEIKLPPEMTKDLPIPDWQKRNISITMHEGDVTPENVKARIQAKYIQFGGKPK